MTALKFLLVSEFRIRDCELVHPIVLLAPLLPLLSVLLFLHLATGTIRGLREVDREETRDEDEERIITVEEVIVLDSSIITSSTVITLFSSSSLVSSLSTSLKPPIAASVSVTNKSIRIKNI